ncbi:MAG TPA: ABC transporter permease [Fibrobacteria bacterium]|nr:ABC transporter permease [Fibrobacteria bacterium]
MKLFVLRRVLAMVPMLLGVSVLSFLLLQLSPGDPLSAQRGNPQVPDALIHRIETEYGFDKPVPEQYLLWLSRTVRGDLGYSFKYKRPVADVIRERVGATLLLAVFSSLLSWLLAVPLGVWAALRRGRWPDRLVSLTAFVGMSLPSFFLALLLLFAASVAPPIPGFGRFPIGGLVSPEFDQLSLAARVGDVLRHLLIPGLVLAVGGVAGLQRVTRGSMLETLRQPFVLAARARGLSQGSVLWRHAFRNAANPLITLLGFEFSALLSGAAFTEIITSWPGLGLVALEAVRAKDLFLVMATVLMGSFLLLAGNLISDILHAWNDPRVKLS